VRIVSDSASDILPVHAQAMGIMMVSNRIILDGHVLRDGIDITASHFYARLRQARQPPYTEPASPNDFYYAYQAAIRDGATAIVSIHVSRRLSRVVQHAMAARDAVGADLNDGPAVPIAIVDSQQTGIGMWPAIIGGAQLANMGASLQEVHARVVSLLARTQIYFMVESLEHLRRGGRIGRARVLLGTLLDAHPILTIDQGEVSPVETVRPRSRALLRLRELVFERGAIDSLLICGTSIESIAQVEALLAEQYRGVIQKTWLGPTNGTNTGPAIAIAVVVQ
jgi:DegV family protein with EDD domain